MNKKVLITGSTSGLGYEFTQIFAKEGYDLTIHGRDINRLNRIKRELEEKYNSKVEILICDLSNLDEVEALTVILADKTFDIFVNNAGYDVSGDFITNNYEDELKMISVNILAATRLAKIVGRTMADRGKGKILNLGSIVSYVPGPHHAIYAASKSYILNFSLSIREELRKNGVNVSVLCPGPTKTNFAKRANIETAPAFSKNMLKPSFVARKGYKGLMNNRAIILPGFKVKLDIFLSRIIPMPNVLKITSKKMTLRKEGKKEVTL